MTAEEGDDRYEMEKDRAQDRRDGLAVDTSIASENVIDDRLDNEHEAAEDDEWADLLDEEDEP